MLPEHGEEKPWAPTNPLFCPWAGDPRGGVSFVLHEMWASGEVVSGSPAAGAPRVPGDRGLRECAGVEVAGARGAGLVGWTVEDACVGTGWGITRRWLWGLSWEHGAAGFGSMACCRWLRCLGRPARPGAPGGSQTTGSRWGTLGRWSALASVGWCETGVLSDTVLSGP